jgi:hypothetical protein
MSRRHRLHFVASRTHKWLALIIGIQLLLWFASGFVMSLLPIERVRGEHLVDLRRAEALKDDAALVPPASIAAQFDQPVRSLTFRPLLGRPVAEVEFADGSKVLRDAVSGSALTIGASLAESIARAAYVGPGKPVSVTRIRAESTEYRGSLPAWRVDFADPDSTRVFVAQDTGRISAVRTGTWRIYDFLWGLHIMDWKNHEDFNTPWLIGFAVAALALFSAGLMLLFMRWPLRRRRRRAALQRTQT